MGWFNLVVITLCICTGTWAYVWTQEPGNDTGRVVTVCTGQDLELHWKYDLQNSDYVFFMTFEVGKKRVAVYPGYFFLAMKEYVGRVEFVENAGITLRNVTPADAGNYTICITLNGDPWNSELQTSWAIVRVTVPPTTNDGKLVMLQGRDAVFVEKTQDFHVVMTCGNFTFLGQPPVTVTWVTSSNENKSTTISKNDTYLLTVDNPPKGGRYSCYINRTSPAAHCLASSSGLLQRADIDLDEVQARLTLLEAREAAQKANASQHILDYQKLLRAFEGPCGEGNHTVRNDAWRNMNGGITGSRCDNDLPATGWYRFQLNGANAVMPTTCPPSDGRCGTSAALWLDLRGGTMPSFVGQEVRGQYCARFQGGCCQWQQQQLPIIAKNCGRFFVYKLPRPHSCDLAYCATLNN